MRDPITADRARRRTVGGSRRRLLPALGTWAFFLTFAGQGVRNAVGWWAFGLIAAISEVILLLVFLHEGHRVPRRALPPLTGAYTALCLASVLWSQYPAATALAGALMLATTAVGVLLACGLSLREMTDALSRALEAILVLSILLELYVGLVLRRPLIPVYMQDWKAVPISYYWVNGEILHGGPIQGIVGNRNPLAFIALLTLLCTAVRWADRRVRPFGLVVWSGLSALVLALTASATVLVAVVVCVVITAVLWLMRHVPVARRRLVSGVALSLGVALAAAGLGLAPVDAPVPHARRPPRRDAHDERPQRLCRGALPDGGRRRRAHRRPRGDARLPVLPPRHGPSRLRRLCAPAGAAHDGAGRAVLHRVAAAERGQLGGGVRPGDLVRAAPHDRARAQ